MTETGTPPLRPARRRRPLRLAFRGVAAVALFALAAAIWQQDRLTRLAAVLTLFEPDRIVGNFTAMDRLFESRTMPLSGAPASEQPRGPDMQMPPGFDAWAAERSVTAIVVLKDGVIRHESYPLSEPGREDDPALRTRISWSVAKSFLSVLTGILLEEGAIQSLDDPVTRYVPALQGSAYDGTSLRQLMWMASGVVFDEDYLDFWSDINKMGRVLALGRSMDAFAAGLTDTFAPPGTDWQYVSIDTHVLGMVLRGATGRPLPDLMKEKLLDPLRLEVEPYYVTDGYGVAFALGGLNLTTRDYARFGDMVARGGVTADGARIVSEAWIAESTAATAPTGEGESGYGYQWWIPEGSGPGQVLARGVYGQYIHIDRPRGVVIAVNAADRLFRDPGVHEANVAMLRQIAEALD